MKLRWCQQRFKTWPSCFSDGMTAHLQRQLGYFRSSFIQGRKIKRLLFSAMSVICLYDINLALKRSGIKQALLPKSCLSSCLWKNSEKWNLFYCGACCYSCDNFNACHFSRKRLRLWPEFPENGHAIWNEAWMSNMSDMKSSSRVMRNTLVAEAWTGDMFSENLSSKSVVSEWTDTPESLSKNSVC